MKAKERTKAGNGTATRQRFSDHELAAMRDHAAELKKGKGDGEADVLAKIGEMGEPDRTLAQRLHQFIRAAAPELTPRTWYGMPAYDKDGALLCWYQPAQKFKSRYGFLGFSDKAKLDDGAVWPISYAITQLTATEEKQVGALLQRALGRG